MGGLAQSRASLRIMGDVDFDEISALLGRAPMAAPRGKGWRLETSLSQPGDLDGQIREILRGMSDDRDAWRELGARIRIDMFCGLFLEEWNEGVVLAPETLKLLSDRGIALSLDIYAPDECRDRDEEP